MTFDDGLKIMGSSDATKLGGNERPSDFCDIDNDENTSEPLPFDAEGVAYESTGPYHAGAYQHLGNPKAFKFTWMFRKTQPYHSPEIKEANKYLSLLTYICSTTSTRH